MTKKVLVKKRNLEYHIKGYRAVHGDKYDYSQVTEESIRNKRIIIGCPIHGDFPQDPSNHKAGKGCKDCGDILRAKKKTKTTDWFVEEARKVHGDRYDYSLVKYTRRRDIVWIICKEHGKFPQRAGHHLNGENCRKCADKQGALIRSSNTLEFIEKAKQVHGERYDYSLVDYVNNHTVVQLICDVHGVFNINPQDHLDGSGCQTCSKRKFSFRKEKWIELAGDRLGVFYIIRCYNETESFYKYGISSRFDKRFNKGRLPYDFEIVRMVMSSDKDYIWELERRFGDFKVKDNYVPLIKMDGTTECFKTYKTNPNRR